MSDVLLRIENAKSQRYFGKQSHSIIDSLGDLCVFLRRERCYEEVMIYEAEKLLKSLILFIAKRQQKLNYWDSYLWNVWKAFVYLFL